MPSTANDALSETTTVGLAQRSEPPSNAVGAELPVTVHASRYSAASKSGKLPPVHEETRTVIIFPQGAVVRLSATVTLGELVVLTNKRTGADVICRVTSVKTQPGIQNYVHLEFTQRALDFWEETPATGGGVSTGKAPVVTASPTVTPPADMPIGSSNRPPSSAVQDQPVAKTGPAVELKSAFAASPKVTPLADIPAAESEEAPEEVPAQASQVSEIAATPAFPQKRPHVMPSRIPRLQPFEPVTPQKRNSSKMIVLFAIAAVVLLAIGAVGGAVLLRRDRGVSAAQQLPNAPVTTTPVPLPLAAESQPPIANNSAKASSREPVASASAKISPPETPAPAAPIRTAVEPPKREVQPQAQPVTRPSINVGKIAAPKMKTAAQLNSSEPPPVLPATTNALTGVIGESVVSTTPRSNLLAPAEPARPAPVQGGQLQQPKLLSSVAAVYPPLAHAQHVQGDVTIDALIDATGKVAATNVITGSPLLQKAAMDSLRLWKYQPARLNGEPIPIHIKVTITFHLN